MELIKLNRIKRIISNKIKVKIDSQFSLELRELKWN